MRLHKLDLNQLVCLDTLLTEQSVSRAAEKLFVTQPTMSSSLTRLREYFEDRLLVQVGRQMVLTPFARQLVEPVRDVLLQAMAITAMRPEVDPSKLNREIIVGASDLVSSVLLTSVMRRASNEAPGIRVRTVSILGTRFFDALDRGEIDILVIPKSYASSDHPQHALFQETFCCIVGVENPLVRDSLTIDQYLQMGHVAAGPFMYEVEHRAYEDGYLQKLGYTRKIEVAVPNFLLLPEYTAGTQRIATVHTRLAQRYIKHWPLRIVPFPLDIPPLLEVVQWHKYQEKDPAISWFRSILKDEAAKLQAS